MHSAESLSFHLREAKALFTGYAIPVPGDIPIYVSASDSLVTLSKLAALEEIDNFYSAWDIPREKQSEKNQ